MLLLPTLTDSVWRIVVGGRRGDASEDWYGGYVS
jgi:hypothetical protein